MSVYLAGGTTPSATVTIQTSMQATDDDGWVTLGTFGAVTTSNNYQRLSMTGAMRYVRYTVTLTGTTPVFVFDISGYARVWS